MKLPMLFKSLFDFEADNAALDVTPEPSVEPNPQPHSVPKPQPESIQTDEARHDPDPLLDSIDALGKIVLALDAQLRAERSSSAQLRSCMNDELAALRTALLQ
ncbi:hypothetical protein LMG27952_06062 [Paraburkholderia hiiakae]|uniref:Uncharacterized protein n=1 Tax=Paraburkholderia hiiakae TaxID=1081782 RepID=A0ABM8P4N5_9BURK|nr:hypothetical protein [Paraburkholderia hiiakae]CAD6556322.1 hypothetical protein LMG27952_06062 [Paraburkholderia hiiakae]